MNALVKYALFALVSINLLVCTGCEDPIASTVKSTQEAATKAAEIKSNEKVELERIAAEERKHERELQAEEDQRDHDERMAEYDAIQELDPNQTSTETEKDSSVNVTEDNEELAKNEGVE